MVQMPVVETTPNERTDDALPDAQPRVDSGGWSRVFDLLERANTVIDRQADEIGTLRERAARAETERDSALAERDRARQFQQDALDSNLEYFERWMEQVQENSDERQRTADALARANELAEQLDAERTRADAAEAERDRLRGRRWWWWPW